MRPPTRLPTRRAFICGTTGEGASLTRDERCQIVESWIAARPPGLAVIVHVGHLSLEEARWLCAARAVEWRCTDTGWNACQAERRTRIEAMNTAARAAHAAYCNRRRDLAQAYLASTREEPVPVLPPGFPVHKAIDHFLAARIAQVAAQFAPARQNGGVDFHRDIQPIFEAQCHSCHQGAKVKGGLRLDLREEALLGGNADGPAVVPHRPDESALIQRIASTDTDEIMPAKGDPLPASDVALLRRWIAEGAVWPDFPVQSLALTPLADDSRVFTSCIFGYSRHCAGSKPSNLSTRSSPPPESPSRSNP